MVLLETVVSCISDLVGWYVETTKEDFLSIVIVRVQFWH